MTLKLNWTEIENIDKIVRERWIETESQLWYNLDSIHTRTIKGSFNLVLIDNKPRFDARRKPPAFKKLTQPFSEEGFNFNKVKTEEKMLQISKLNKHLLKDNLEIIINVSPILRYHSLIVPYPLQCMPQIMDEYSLRIILDFLMKSSDLNVIIIGNSLLAHASVNHLHFHLLYPEFRAACTRAKGGDTFKASLRELVGYFFPGIIILVTEENLEEVKHDLVMVIEVLILRGIAHNIVFCKRDENTSLVLVFPRKSTLHMQKSQGMPSEHKVPFFVAACELAGIIPVVSGFEDLTECDCVSLMQECKLDDATYEETIEHIKSMVWMLQPKT